MSYYSLASETFYRDVPLEIFIVGIFICILFAFTFIYILIRDVARSAKESDRDYFEAFVFIKKSEPIFSEYYRKHRPETDEKFDNEEKLHAP